MTVATHPFRVISLLKRPEGTTPEAFWAEQALRNNHRQWRAQLAEAGCTLWAFSTPVKTEYNATNPIADWVDEYHFATLEQAQNWRQHLAQPHASSVLTAVADVVVPKACPTHIAPSSLVRVLRFAKKREDITINDFRQYWQNTHAPIASASPFLCLYEQLHVNDSEYQRQPPDWDGFTLSCFLSADDIAAHAQHPAGAKAATDTVNFLSPTSTPRLIIQHAGALQPT